MNYSVHGVKIIEYARSLILKSFTKKWHPTEAKHTSHSLVENPWQRVKTETHYELCTQCRKYYHLQLVFPAQPIFSHQIPSAVSLSCTITNENDLTRSILKDLNDIYVQQFGHTFVQSVVQNCKDVEAEEN